MVVGDAVRLGMRGGVRLRDEDGIYVRMGLW